MSNTDDPEMPVNTLRVWVLGILFAIVIPGMNQFFFFRYPAVSITGVRVHPSLTQLLAPRVFSFPSHHTLRHLVYLSPDASCSLLLMCDSYPAFGFSSIALAFIFNHHLWFHDGA